MTDDKVLRHKEKLKDDLEQGNLRSYNELDELLKTEFGRQLDMDTSDLRREKIIEHLVLTGVWTPEQLLDYEIAFYRGVEEQLSAFWVEMRERISEKNKPKLAVVKKGGVFLDNHGRPVASE